MLHEIVQHSEHWVQNLHMQLQSSHIAVEEGTNPQATPIIP